MNEILRLRYAPAQNDIGEESVISSKPRSGDREIPLMILLRIPSQEDAPSWYDEGLLLMSLRAAGEAISSISYQEIATSPCRALSV